MEHDLIAKQANRLVESIYRMEVEEQRVLLLAIKKVNNLELQKQHFDGTTEIIITSQEYAKTYGVPKQRSFEALVKAKNSIFDRIVTIQHLSANGETKPVRTRWIYSDGDSKTKSEVSLFFSPKVIPFIYLVREEFTLQDLREVGRLKSKYAVRLYGLLMKWRNAEYKPYFSIPDLRDKLGLEPHEYKSTGDFNIRVVSVAVDQINKGTGFVGLRAIPKKEGRTIVGFGFKYDKYDNETINITPLAAKTPKKAPELKTFFVYQMTDDQIRVFSSKIAKKAVKATPDEPIFVAIGQKAEPGQGDWSLQDKIIDDFVEGNFEPYYEALQALNFKPTVFNRTKPTSAVKDAQKGENSEDEAKTVGDEGKQEKASESAGESQTEISEDEGEGLNDESTVVYTEFSDSDIENYNLYVNKTNGKRTLNEILTMCNEMGKPPGLVIGMLIQKKIK